MNHQGDIQFIQDEHNHLLPNHSSGYPSHPIMKPNSNLQTPPSTLISLTNESNMYNGMNMMTNNSTYENDHYEMEKTTMGPTPMAIDEPKYDSTWKYSVQSTPMAIVSSPPLPLSPPSAIHVTKSSKALHHTHHDSHTMTMNALHNSSPLTNNTTTTSSTATTHTNISSQRKVSPKFQLSDFQILNTLGTGSFGRVHLVKHIATSKYYAMKVLRKNEIVKLKQVEHTLNEKSILEQLNYPFLVNMLGTFQDSVNLYFVMEYVVGGELFSYLRKSGVKYSYHCIFSLLSFFFNITKVFLLILLDLN